MKKFHTLLIVFIIPLSVWAKTSVSYLIEEKMQGLFCPGVELVLSCGNNICENTKGENATSCPADCVSALIRSYNNQTLCNLVQKIESPKNEEEAKNILTTAVSQGKRIRIVGNSHSANEILCTDGLVISTQNLKNIFAIEKFEGEETVRLQPGVTLEELTEWLHTRNKSIGYSIMGFNGVSIAGAIATGSHGSSLKHTAVISNIVKSLRVLKADGTIEEFSEKSSDPKIFKALSTNLGLLGMVTEIRLKIQSQKNLHVNVTYEPEEKLFEEGGVFKLVENCDWGQINWYPGAKSFMKSCGVETTRNADPGAHNRLIDPKFPSFIVKPVKQIMQLSACHQGIACLMDKVRFAQLKMAPPFEVKNQNQQMVSSASLVGPSHRMMTSQLTSYQKGFFQMDWEIAVPKSKALDAMKAVREHLKKNNVCLPLVGVFLRFAPSENKTLMSHTVAQGDFVLNEPVVFIEIPVYLPTNFPAVMKAAYDKVYEDFAKLLIEKFSGRAHWGKNRDWVFKLQAQRNTYEENFKLFESVVREFDPHGIFSNQFSENIGIVYQ